LDGERPNAARMYDYALGGRHNTAVDRAAADDAFARFPNARHVAATNRSFLRRAVRFAARLGVDQFLDLGSGIPTVGNVHEIAEEELTTARVVYVDVEPVAVAETERLLADAPRASAVRADLRDADVVLERARRLLDFSRPVALLAVAALHYLGRDEDVPGLLARYRAELASGSLLAISHTTDEHDPEGSARIRELLERTSTPATHRSRAEVAALFAGTELVEPGVVWTPEWRPDMPDPVPAESETWCGVGIVR